MSTQQDMETPKTSSDPTENNVSAEENEEVKTDNKVEVADVPVTHVVGIDLGTDTAVVSLVSVQSLRPDLLRNDLSNQQTPFSVCLHGKERSFGELAVQKLTSKLHLQNSVNGSAVFNAMENSSKTTSMSAVGRLKEVEGEPMFQVEYDAEELLLRPDQVMAMFLAKLKTFILSSLEKEEKANVENVPVGIVIPDTFGEEQRKVVQRALELAGMPLCKMVTRGAASAMTYGTKKSREVLEANRRVMIVDIGSGYGTISVYRWGNLETAEEGAATDDVKEGHLLAFRCSPALGSNEIDAVLFQKLVDQCKAKHGFEIKYGTKAGTRLMTQTTKLKKTLSQVPEGKITVESVGPDGQDASLSASRGDLEAACVSYKEELSRLLTECLQEALAKEGVPEDLQEGFLQGGVELVGGGTYVPWLQATIREVAKPAVNPGAAKSDPKIGGLCFTLDSMAAPALGASYMVAKQFEPTGAVVRPVFDTLAKLSLEGDEGVFGSVDPDACQTSWLADAAALEAKMKANDKEMAMMHSERNKLEAYLFECRSIANGSREHSSLVDKDQVLPVLDQAEEWLWDEGDVNAADASWQKYRNKFEELSKSLEEPLKVYNEKVEEERLKKEKQLKEEAEKAAAEAANGEKDDHDFRKLKKPERMRKVTMNKEEGVSLFKDGNHEAASNRFIRALQHTTKFFDLSPDDEKEVETVKHSLHLNLAQCYIKLTKWDEVVKSCSNALEIDDNSVKALYRRSMAYERTRKFDHAKKDILKAHKELPEDKAIAKLKDRIDAQLKIQAAKQKKMAQKMFG